jgi:hypothetical protein
MGAIVTDSTGAICVSAGLVVVIPVVTDAEIAEALGETLMQTPDNVLAAAGAKKTTVIAGATIGAGMPVYKDVSAGNRYKPSQANALATARCDGIALDNATNGQPLVIQTPTGKVNVGLTLVVGTVYGVSPAVAGLIVPISDYVSGDFPVILGIADTTTELFFDVIAAGIQKP